MTLSAPLPLLTLLAIFALSACAWQAPGLHAAAADEVTQPAPCKQQLLTRMYFGLNMPKGRVSEAQWQKFVSDEVTPLFPEGLTVLQAQGQWQKSDGSIEREASRVLEVLHVDAAYASRATQFIALRYKQLFKQESVLRTNTSITACF
jgi:hypothetical protein